MSKVIKQLEDRDLAHIVELDGELYYIDSADTFDQGYETMVFAAGRYQDDEDYSDYESDDLDINWKDLYCERYSSEEAMEIKHKYIINHLEEFLN